MDDLLIGIFTRNSKMTWKKKHTNPTGRLKSPGKDGILPLLQYVTRAK